MECTTYFVRLVDIRIYWENPKKLDELKEISEELNNLVDLIMQKMTSLKTCYVQMRQKYLPSKNKSNSGVYDTQKPN